MFMSGDTVSSQAVSPGGERLVIFFALNFSFNSFMGLGVAAFHTASTYHSQNMFITSSKENGKPPNAQYTLETLHVILKCNSFSFKD